MSEPQKVTRAKQKGALGPVPKQPTEGWMRHELEANGVRAPDVEGRDGRRHAWPRVRRRVM